MDPSQPSSRVDALRHRVAAAIAAYRQVAQILGDTEELATLRDELFAALVVALDASFPGRSMPDGGASAEMRALAVRILAGEQALVDDDRLEELASAFLDALESR